ncbi:MAG: carbohydrate kinase family protein [Firmicutes bacterium]|nr:carbohydrate kinase family protein [Bacillota bacterium]
MLFGIMGPISKDQITLDTGEQITKYGAVAYSVSALAKLLEGTEDRVVCLSHISKTNADEIISLLTHPNVDLSGLLQVDRGMTEIKLTYQNEYNRQSLQISVMTPLTKPEMSLLAGCSAILCLPLNETDIPLECITELRKTSKAALFLDAHGLVTGVNQRQERYRKTWPTAEAWLSCLDIIKMNANEASWVAGQPLKERESYVHFAAGLVQTGLQSCWITFGGQSSLIAWRRQNRVFWAEVPVVTGMGRVIDTTGCGDASSAGFIYTYAKMFHNSLFATIMGNTLGSLKATFPETNAFPPQPEIRGVIGSHYRDYLHTLLDDFLINKHFIVHEIEGDGQ